MIDSNETDAPPPRRLYRVYTDGSATTLSTKTGGYAALIYGPDQAGVARVCGSAAPTTISRMELMAPIAALEWILEREGGCRDEFRVEIHSDSQFFTQCALGVYERRANLLLWAAWDEATRDVDVAISWTPRNVLPAQSLCDKLAGKVRRSLEAAVDDFSFAGLQIVS
jgi:ribonuclease HI